MEFSEVLKRSKKCRVCNKKLSVKNCTYYRLRNYVYLCNNCDREEKRKWARKKYNQDKSLSSKKSLNNQRKYAISKPINHKCNQMYSSSKKRAKILGISHDINSCYLLTIAPEICPATKIKLNYLSNKKDKNSPSLDRIDPLKGYIVGNVQIISYLANLMKSNANPDELLNFADWINSTMKK